MVQPHPKLKLVTAILVVFSISTATSRSISRNAPLDLIILHNNDMHARFEQTSANSNTCSKEDITNNKCYGGFARVAYEYGLFFLHNYFCYIM